MLTKGKIPSQLKSFLIENVKEKHLIGDLGVADPHFGGAIQNKLSINCVFDNNIIEVMKLLRSELEKLISGEDMRRMSVGLSHSLSRFKLKFSPEKIDVMIVQAVGLLEDIDKEINTYSMRVRFFINDFVFI
jgi:nucleolar protein 58